MSSPNKFNFPGRSTNNEQKSASKTNFFFAKVENVNDPYDGYIIQARIKGTDDQITKAQLPNAFPLHSKFFSSRPKVGETVLIFIPETDNMFENRMYMGPIISQPQRLKFDPHLYSSTSLLNTGYVSPSEAPSTLPDAKGVYPNKEDISIQGRGNNDIILKDKEILIRSGKFIEIERDIPKFNRDSIGYIQIKSDYIIDKEKDYKGTITNIVSSKINLLTHRDGSPNFSLSNPDTLITDDEMDKILKDAHPLPYGDLLVEFLIKFRDAFIDHVHPYHGKTPENLAGKNSISEVLNYDFNKLLSKNIKIN
jgi:hypothetical protein